MPGFVAAQWQAFLALYRAQEQHVLHLVQPAWETHYPTLWHALSPEGPPQLDVSPLLRLLRVLLVRACFHCNVSVRRMGLSGLLEHLLLPAQANGGALTIMQVLVKVGGVGQRVEQKR